MMLRPSGATAPHASLNVKMFMASFGMVFT